MTTITSIKPTADEVNEIRAARELIRDGTGPLSPALDRLNALRNAVRDRIEAFENSPEGEEECDDEQQDDIDAAYAAADVLDAAIEWIEETQGSKASILEGLNL